MDLLKSGKGAKFGTNLKAHKRLVADERARLEDRRAPLGQATQAFVRKRNAIITRSAARRATKAVFEHRQAYHQALTKTNGDAEAIRQARARLRAAADRVLRASVPKFSEFEALRDRYLQDRADFFASGVRAQKPGLDFQLGDVRVPAGATVQNFTAPFPLFDVSPPAKPPDVRSFVLPRVGMVGTSLKFSFSGSNGAIIQEFNPGLRSTDRSSVGINFRVPQTGVLSGSAVIQNLASDFVMKLSDNFGFSSGTLHVNHSVFVTIIRSGEIQQFERLVFSDGLISHGSDLSVGLSPILDETPFTVSFTGRDAFLKGEQIQILVGQAVEVGIHLDDMTSVFSALTVWQVKRLSISMQTNR